MNLEVRIARKALSIIHHRHKNLIALLRIFLVCTLRHGHQVILGITDKRLRNKGSQNMNGLAHRYECTSINAARRCLGTTVG